MPDPGRYKQDHSIPHSTVIFGKSLLEPIYIAEIVITSALRNRLGSHSRFKLRNVGKATLDLEETNPHDHTLPHFMVVFLALQDEQRGMINASIRNISPLTREPFPLKPSSETGSWL